MVLIQNLAGALEIQTIVAALFPGQLDDVFEPSAYDVVLGRGRIDFFEPLQLAVSFLADVLGEIGLGQALAQGFRLGLLGIGFAELLLDGLFLLAQHIVALLFGHLGFGFFGNLGAQLGHVHFMRQPAQHHAQGFDAGRSLEQRLLLFHVQVHDGRDQKRQLQRVALRGKCLGDFLRRLPLHQIDELGGHLDNGEGQGFELTAGVVGQRQRPDSRLQEAVFLDFDDDHALGALHEQVDMVGPRAPRFADDRAGTDGVEIGRAVRLHRRVLLGDHNHFFVFGGQGRLYGGYRRLAAHSQRHQESREQHGILQRQQRQCSDFFFVHNWSLSQLSCSDCLGRLGLKH